MAKSDRIASGRQKQLVERSNARLPGFYAVEGIDNAASDAAKAQPAYWDGGHWHIIGWDSPVSDSQHFNVTSPLDL